MTTEIAGKSSVELCAPGSGRLRRELSAFSVLLLTLSCLSPVLSIYGIGSDVLKHAGTGSAMLFVIGMGFAAVWAMVYAELGSAYPYAGGDYVGVGSVLGPWAGFLSLVIWAATTPPMAAFEAQVMAQYTAELFPAWPPMTVTFGSLLLATLVALLAVRASALVTGVFLALEMIAVIALTAAGTLHPARSLAEAALHPVIAGAGGGLVPTSLGALALGAVSAAFATAGGNQALAFGEELGDPHRRMGKVVMWAAMIGAAATALPVIAVALGARDLNAMLASPAPFAAFVGSIGGPWAVRALSGMVVLAVFNALIAQIMFTARLFFSIGRDDIFHPVLNRLLASVDSGSGAPRAATLFVAAITGACCLIDGHALVVFTAGTTAPTLALVSLAVIVGRRKGLTGQSGTWRSWLFPLAPALGLVISAIFLLTDLLDPDAGRPGVLILIVMMAAGAAWYGFVLRRRPGGWAPRLGT
jgi:amino acid transporter